MKSNDLPGKPGEPGPQGRTGPRGDTGVQGVMGQTGPEGRTGPRGQTGAQGPTGEVGPQGPTGLLGEALAQTITLLTGGKIRTSDENTRLDADGFWLRTVPIASNAPSNRLNFYTGTWTNKTLLASMTTLTDTNEIVTTLDLSLFDTTVDRNATLQLGVGAGVGYLGTLRLRVENEYENTRSQLTLASSPTGAHIELDAPEAKLTGYLDLAIPVYATGTPVTGHARMFVRATGVGNSKQQIVAVFKSGAVQVIATEP